VIGKLVFENLKNRPMRSLLSILLIGVPVTLMLSLVGLTQGLLQESQRRQRSVGADIIVRAPTVNSLINYSGAAIPQAIIGVIEKLPHVAMATGVINHSIEPPLFITGIDMASFDRMSGGFTYVQGGPLQHPGEVLVDEPYARQKHLHVGDTLELLNHPWRVTGIIGSGKLARIVLPLNVLQDLDNATGKVSQIYVKADRPSNTDEVVREIHDRLPNYPVITMADFIAAINVGNVPGLAEFTAVIVGIGIVIGFSVVCLSMYMAVLQRTREIGILKSLGASKGFILAIILLEALSLGIGGTILGIVFSFGARWLIDAFVPASLPMVIVPIWWPIAGGITLVGTGLGSLYPGLRAATHDPIEALAYE
jgi:putative ABC transport system permease protein